MTESEPDSQPETAPLQESAPGFSGSALALPFGPAFFLNHLGSFIRDTCPQPAEALPVVELHLGNGTTLDLCHVIAIADAWLAVAVRDESHGDSHMAMHTALVPYSLICRMSIRATAANEPRVGFDANHVPRIDAACAGPNPAPECVFLPVSSPQGGRKGAGEARAD